MGKKKTHTQKKKQQQQQQHFEKIHIGKEKSFPQKKYLEAPGLLQNRNVYLNVQSNKQNLINSGYDHGPVY